MKKTTLMAYSCLFSLFLSFTVSAAKKQQDGSHIQPDNLFPRVEIQTSMGNILVELDRYKAPITVNNFLRYVEKRMFTNTVFHRVIKDFVIQGGGYSTDYEGKPDLGDIYNESGNGLKNTMYTIAMARQNDPHTANRQFYFNLGDNTNLDPGRNWGYAVFGSVIEGTEVLDAMSQVPTEYRPLLGMPNAPVDNIVLKEVVLLPPL